MINRIIIFLFVSVVGALSTTSFLMSQKQNRSKSSRNVVMTVSGVVIDKGTQLGLDQVTVRLFSVKDSALLTGAITAREGSFSIQKVVPGQYFIEVSYIGFERYKKGITVSANPEGIFKVPTIFIGESASLLKEAVVVGQHAEMVVKQDTIEYNTGAYKLQESAVVEDLLKRLPGVDVDQDGKIKVKGKEVTKIMVDGKEMFKGDPAMSTKNIPIEMIDKLQVIDDKSELSKLTGIDDGEEVTVINLTIKKGMKQSWMVNASAGVGADLKAEPNRDPRYELNAFATRMNNNLNLTLMANGNNINKQRSGRGGDMGSRGINSSGLVGLNIANEFSPKLTMGGDIRFSISEQVTNSKLLRQNMMVGNESFQRDTTERVSLRNNVNMNYRLVFKPSKQQTFEVRPSFSYNQSESTNSSRRYNFRDIESTDTVNFSRPIDLLRPSSISNSNEFSLGLDLDFSQEFEKKGRKFSASLTTSYSGNESDNENQTFTVVKNDPTRNKQLNQNSNTDGENASVRGYLSWVEPVGKNRFLQMSYSLRYSDRENIKMTYAYDDLTQMYSRLDTAYSKSLYNKNVEQVIGLSFRAVSEKYQYTLGVDANPAYTQSQSFIVGGSQQGADSIVFDYPGRSTTNFAPNLNYTYRFSKEKNLRIDYRGRMRQPSVSQLDPTEDVTNPLNTSSGNPELVPTYTNTLSTTYSSFNRELQRSFNASLRGNYILNGIINKTIYDANTGISKSSPINKSGTWDVSGTVMFNIPIGKKFQINSYSSVTYNNRIGFTTLYNGAERLPQSVEDITKSTRASENLGMTFRHAALFMQLRANFSFQNDDFTASVKKSNQIMNYGGIYNLQFTLPNNWIIGSDVTYNGYSGYSSGYNQQETLWNAEFSKAFLKNKAATIRLQVYDILQQRLSITRTISTNYIQDEQYNALRSYAMISFVYRFNQFGNNANRGRSMGGGGEGGGRMMREGGGMAPMGESSRP